MERAEFLKRMRSMAEALYDYFADNYFTAWNSEVDEIHREYLAKFLALVGRPGIILSAACGEGRFDGLLVEAGHRVVGIDQSAGALARAREHFPIERFPQIQYEKIGMQEMALDPAYQEAFDGLICMDAMEHISPEDWPVIMRSFSQALKPGGPLYLTADARDAAEIKTCYERALAMGLPVIYGEIADEVEAEYQRAVETGVAVDQCVYHFVPPLEQIRAWLAQAGLAVVEVCEGGEYHHILALKCAPPCLPEKP